MKNLPLNIYCELICFIVSLIVCIRNKSIFSISFLIYLGILSILETIAYYQTIHNLSARMINNFLNILGLFFYCFIMINFFLEKKEVNIVKLLLVGYSLYWLYEMFIAGMINRFDMPIWVVSWLIQILICLLFFKLYLQKDINLNIDYYKAAFYLAMGLFVFCFGSIVVIAFAREIRIRNLLFFNIPLHQFIIRLLCIPLYGFISLALLKWKPFQIMTSTRS